MSNAEGAGQPVNVRIISPDCHIDEEFRRVPDGESKSEPVYTNICMYNKCYCHRKMLQRFYHSRGRYST